MPVSNGRGSVSKAGGIIQYLLHTYDRHPDYVSIRGMVVSALGPLTTQEDAVWLMDLCFAQK